MVGLILPQCAHFTDKKALVTHQRHDNASYERIVTTPQRLTRYYAQEPAVCAGDYVLSVITLRSFVYIERLDNKTAYAVFVDEQHVCREHCGSIDTVYTLFDYFISLGHPLFVTHNDDYVRFGHGMPINPVGVNTVPDSYHLVATSDKHKKNRLPQLASSLSLSLLLLAGGVLTYKYLEPPARQANVQPISPVEVWHNAFITKTPATAGLTDLSYALSYFYLLPTDWMIGDVSLENSTVTITVKPKDKQGLFATLDTWLGRYPEIALFFDKDTRTFSMPVKAQNVPTWARLGNYPTQLHDLLLMIGATSLTQNQQPNIGKVKQWQYTAHFDEVPFAFMTTLANVLKNKPVFIDGLTVSQGSFYTYISFDLTLTLEGITDEQ
ncbi:hypothetical protein C9J12_25700 [Photobacterium frigidiphilum]|uniref:Uncharacterized protein n=1 Tax=Photobacterium frigidiphilum TaxID=264736 RepID=A0A2T3J7R2_9GAMM|nr:hypothetical protein [Photobacterium frigidiphilum]PSU44795.1 hypothetical protein C9J12_25700 [Photobacterium frigidiphilum]